MTSRRASIVLLPPLLLLLAGLWACAGSARDAGTTDPEELLDEVLDGLLARNPEWASQLRLFEGPLDPQGHRLTDVSPAAHRERQAFLAKSLARARLVPLDGLEDHTRDAFEAMLWFLEDAERGAPFLFHDYPVNQVFGAQNRLISLLTQVQPVRNKQEARAYVARLEQIGPKLDGLIEGLRLRAEAGVVPPDAILGRVKQQLDDFLLAPLADNPFQAAFRRKLQESGLSEGEQHMWLERSAAVIETAIVPAWESLFEALEAQQARGRPGFGVWRLPQGDAYYRFLVRHHTTLELGPETLHEIGRQEVARIQGEMRAIHAARGIDTASLSFDVSLERFHESVGGEAGLSFADSEAGRDEALDAFKTIIEDAYRRVAPLFHLVPSAPVHVARIPPAVEGSTPAHYRAPSFDGLRPGVFYANLSRPPWRPSMPTLAYHEAVPGHHFHLALVREQPGLLRSQRVIAFTAHVEGWALYAERLAREEGFLPDALARHESLWSELFRAARLVVDTGIHHRRWSRKQALAYMQATLGSPMELEVDRYAVMPGQALAYKAGELEIVRLREEARRSLGEDFEIGDFHEAVIGGGNLPLPVLASRLERLLAQRSGSH